MKSNGPERPEPDPSWTDFSDRTEKDLVREESEQYRIARPLRIAKRTLFLCMILFPAAYFYTPFRNAWVHSYRTNYSPKPPELPPRPANAPMYEQPVLDLVKPVMLERHALKDFDVMFLKSGLRIRIRTGETRGTRMSQVFGIMEDIREMRRSMPELPACAWVLEFDHDTPDHVTVVLPDAKHGYRAFQEWHEADLYTDDPTTNGEARP